ncbi:MAG: FAD-dependent oxidoreductase [Fimbriimonas sp.]
MSRPVVLVVDPDSEITCQMADDLRARFRGIHLLTTNSEAKGREIGQRLVKDSRRLALLLCDIGYERLIGEITEQHPEAKRALLVPYMDKPRAIQAMAERLAHYYIVKPWQPAQDRLYPVVSDLLDDWAALHEPKAGVIRMYGLRWAPESHTLKDFLSRNQAPYEWTDVSEDEHDTTVQTLLKQNVKLPCVVLPDGTQLECPSVAQLAEQMGLKTEPESSYYDLIIVGGGPGGLAAAVYAASEGLKTVVIESEATGGQAGCSSMIENYLGFPQGLSGADLARRARDQAERFNVEILSPQEATAIRATETYRRVRLASGKEIASRSVILAMGVAYRRLEAPGEDQLFGKGVYYGASYSEAVECEQEVVAVVGGGNAAGQAALHFAQYASKVYLIIRDPSIETATSSYLVDRIRSSENILLIENACVDELKGEDSLSALVVNGEELECSSIFVFIGADPRTDWLPREIVRDKAGYIQTGTDIMRTPGGRWPLKRPPMHLETSMPGVFAVGDVKAGSTKRIANAVGQGAAAVQLVHEYLRELRA